MDMKRFTQDVLTRIVKQTDERYLKKTDADPDTQAEVDNFLYTGEDLTEKFKDEIANFSDAWAWIKDRINRADWSGLRNGDYIPLKLEGGTGETHQMQINIDTYYNTCDSGYIVPHHIDFISKDCYSKTVQWNEENNNNGNADEPAPYLASNLHEFCEKIYSYLPENVANLILDKRTLIEERYSSSGTLTDSTTWEWANIGKVWPPSEVEVIGYTKCGTKLYSGGQDVQYPVFAGSWINRIKHSTPGGSTRCIWWLITVRGGNSTYACCVSYNGYATNSSTSTSYRVPICFRIAAE